MKAKAKIICRGIVQGIGFRPFVYRIAIENSILGFVRNQGDAGVLIIAEGDKKNIELFIRSLNEDKPYLAFYEEFHVEWMKYSGNYVDFKIDKSSDSKLGGVSYLPPDISICQDCLEDIKNEKDNRYNYAFTSCAICGPRYTTITNLPYDRPNTTMKEFPLCESCNMEYTDPLDRRYHAQTTCCKICGPKLKLYKSNGQLVDTNNIFKKVANLISKGFIVAIKGIGGTHLACSATNDDVILRLRSRKGKRKYKPFALLSRDINSVKKFAELNEKEIDLLSSYKRPIVLLKKKDSFPLSKWIAPNLFNVGVMLPYSAIHSLILDNYSDLAFILTSANPSNIPMYIDNNEIKKNISDFADYILLHNREIHQRADDSVVRLTDNYPLLIRRSRGWVPEPIKLPFNLKSITSLGVGPLLSSTGAIALSNRCFPTQYIGNVDTLETLEFLENSLNHMSSLLGVNSFDSVGCDLHPLYHSKRIAQKIAQNNNSSFHQIQHHFAHAVSLMVDNQINLEEEIVTIVADGVGYGADGKIWGGEILHNTYSEYKRIGHLEEQEMPGGDKATKYPIRMLASILSKKLSPSSIKELLISEYLDAFKDGKEEIHVLLVQLDKSINTNLTTSTGRILASISALLKKCFTRTYDGEPAIVLEALASLSNKPEIGYKIPLLENNIINTSELIQKAFQDFQQGNNIADIAMACHNTLADQFAKIAIDYAIENNIQKIGFSGGVAYNTFISKRISKRIKKAGLQFIHHRSLPAGDGGISTGQAIISALREI